MVALSESKSYRTGFCFMDNFRMSCRVILSQISYYWGNTFFDNAFFLLSRLKMPAALLFGHKIIYQENQLAVEPE
jgi:hypothetical protein